MARSNWWIFPSILDTSTREATLLNVAGIIGRLNCALRPNLPWQLRWLTFLELLENRMGKSYYARYKADGDWTCVLGRAERRDDASTARCSWYRLWAARGASGSGLR